MILQCQKCNLFFRSFAKMKHHKAGTLGEQCAGEEKKAVDEKVVEPVGDDTWGYNLGYTPVPVKQETVVKTEEVETNGEKPENETEKMDEKSEAGDENETEKTDEKSETEDNKKEVLKTEVEEKKDSSDLDNVKEEKKDSSDLDNVKVKEEPLDLDGEAKIKEEPMDGDEVLTINRQLYSDGIYKAAPIVLDSDSDEYEPESDESAPSDDDVETHLGMLRRNPFKEKAKKRKRKKIIPANATVIYIKNAAGQKVKKYTIQKESTRWVPPHPWVPYKNQVTVEQVCQFLEMVDYPIAVNEVLKKKFEDKPTFDDYAFPLFQKVNPNAHPLTLRTLVKAKWFEVMNTCTDDKEEDEASQNTKVPEVKRPVVKKIRLNWTL
eukprot:GFUD01029374.1.p1 GENE.GFUD01029374.1~~GFUD01029374.1.p1  ORF type:complete len:378 (-),score=111.66 GFUD01029374.1:57-1190(-)